MRSGRKKETKAEREARELFYEAVLAEAVLYHFGCFFSTIIPHICDGPTDPCHVIDKRWLKPLGARLDKPEAMIYDVRNGVPGCRKIHGQFDRTSMPGIRVYQAELRPVVFEFIQDWEEALEQPGILQAKLDRKCPSGARP